MTVETWGWMGWIKRSAECEVGDWAVMVSLFHLRMSLIFESSCSVGPASILARRRPWLRLLVWELKPTLLGLSPVRALLWCSASEWEESGGRRSRPPDAGAAVIDVQMLRLSHRAPQFCSHCRRTLRVMASFTSSPQLSKMFTSSTYGLRKQDDSGQSRPGSTGVLSTLKLNQ